MNSKRDIRILLVDDHPAIRSGLMKILHDELDMKVVEGAASGEEGVAQFRVHHPDVTLMDIRMKGMNGTEATAAIRTEFPDARIIVLTTFEGDADLQRAIAAGARGYLLKSMLPQHHVSAIRRVHAGEYVFPPEVAVQLAEYFPQQHLTAREIEILELVAAGRANRQIAADLTLAEDTVKRHVSNIFQKLGATDRTQAVAIALRRGVIHL